MELFNGGVAAGTGGPFQVDFVGGVEPQTNVPSTALQDLGEAVLQSAVGRKLLSSGDGGGVGEEKELVSHIGVQSPCVVTHSEPIRLFCGSDRIEMLSFPEIMRTAEVEVEGATLLRGSLLRTLNRLCPPVPAELTQVVEAEILTQDGVERLIIKGGLAAEGGQDVEGGWGVGGLPSESHSCAAAIVKRYKDLRYPPSLGLGNIVSEDIGSPDRKRSKTNVAGDKGH
jgi:hypothetical protein